MAGHLQRARPAQPPARRIGDVTGSRPASYVVSSGPLAMVLGLLARGTRWLAPGRPGPGWLPWAHTAAHTYRRGKDRFCQRKWPAAQEAPALSRRRPGERQWSGCSEQQRPAVCQSSSHRRRVLALRLGFPLSPALLGLS